MLDRKWLTSIMGRGAQLISQPNRSGSDGVAPETSSMTPPASVSRAHIVGAACKAAGFSPANRRISNPLPAPGVTAI